MSRTVDSVEVIIQPVCLRFSLYEKEISYHFTSHPDGQLDAMERFMGIEPGKATDPADINLGFLPVASTVLIKGERNVLVDPGSPHLGFYGLLGRALSDAGACFTGIDTLVVTHWHHDHFGNAGLFPGAELVVGRGELEFGTGIYGAGEVEAKTGVMGGLTEVEDSLDICRGVTVLRTPGHSPGSLCVIVDCGPERVAVAGDTVMTREQFERREFSQWYTEDKRRELGESLGKILAYSPSEMIPGHDRRFRVSQDDGQRGL